MVSRAPQDPSVAKDLLLERRMLGSAGRGWKVALSHGKELPCKSKALFCVQTHVKSKIFQREIYLRKKKRKNIRKKKRVVGAEGLGGGTRGLGSAAAPPMLWGR